MNESLKQSSNEPPFKSPIKMKYVVWSLVAVLLVVHQDNFLWSDGTLLLGFLPIGLAYHAGISLAAGVVWFMATRYCWPPDLEAAAAEAPPTDRAPAGVSQANTSQTNAPRGGES